MILILIPWYFKMAQILSMGLFPSKPDPMRNLLLKAWPSSATSWPSSLPSASLQCRSVLYLMIFLHSRNLMVKLMPAGSSWQILCLRSFLQVPPSKSKLSHLPPFPFNPSLLLNLAFHQLLRVPMNLGCHKSKKVSLFDLLFFQIVLMVPLILHSGQHVLGTADFGTRWKR